MKKIVNEMGNELADDIASLVVDTFQKTKLSGKPIIRSNGVREWTVLAGLVAVHNVGDSLENYSLDLIALTTGVKALPNETIKASEGLLLHDCHAEILCLRAFNRFIVEECINVSSSQYVVKDPNLDKFELNENIKFALYVSELPCGDCSLDALEAGVAESWDTFTELEGGVIRGREGYGIKKRVRTKPGRKDSPLSLSKSCSDKLALTQWKSILNGLSSVCINAERFHLSWLVVPDNKFDIVGLERCFQERCYGSIDSMQFSQTKIHHDWEKTDEKSLPSNSSVIHIPLLGISENIVNSVKEGYYTKSKTPRRNGESLLSRSQLVKQLSKLIDINQENTYVELKHANQEYREIKLGAQKALKNWNSTFTDDFGLFR